MDTTNNPTKYELTYVDKRIPYNIINEESDSPGYIQRKFREILNYYDIYKNGADFVPEGTNGDYIASGLRYKLSSRLINKEARFMFAESPDIKVKSKLSLTPGKTISELIDRTQNFLDSVLYSNNFDKMLLQSAKDCFIAGRIAIMANFNNETGITLTFLKSHEFIAEYKPDEPNVLSKFVSFKMLKWSQTLSEVRFFKKKYVLEKEQDEKGNIKDVCYIEDSVYDGTGKLLQVTFPYQATEFPKIPAVVILNDGLIGNEFGESEIENLMEYESTYSKMSNADIDAERKSMNSIKYVVDMDSESTKNLPTSPGSFWDLSSDQNANPAYAQIGTIESGMNYSTPLESTLNRIKSSMYSQADIPDVSLENMSGVVTSGKALKSIYWPLIVRCKEKLKTWYPKLKYLMSTIIDGAILYPESAAKYTNEPISQFEYDIKIEINYPLMEDEQEEKEMDLQEVSQQTMSRKAYIKKWRELSEDQVNEELKQIALEKQMLEDVGFTPDESFEM